MNTIRVLQAITGLGVGGAERVVLDLAQGVDPESIESQIVAFGNDVGAFAVYGRPVVPHHLIDVKGDGRPKLWRVRDYVRLLQTFKPHVIHAHMFHALILTLIATRIIRWRPAIVFTSHNAHVSPMRAGLVRATRGIRHVDIVFSPGQHPRLNARRTVVIPNGVSVAREPPKRPVRARSDPIRFVSVGRLVDQKNPVGLVQAFARAAIPKSRLDFIGAGPLEDDVRASVQALGLEQQVALLGLRNDVREQLRAADAFVLHSDYEGLPLALLEAGAEALPVVSTPVGAIPDVLADGRGYLSEKADMPRALRHVADLPGEAAECGRRLFDHITSRYSVAAMITAHQNLYRSLANETPA